MDQKELQQNIALSYSRLSPKLQEFFSSMIWLENLKKISEKYKLNQEQEEMLGAETTLVLLGVIHLVEYEEILTNKLGLSNYFTEKILSDIEELILKGVRSQLSFAYEANIKSENNDKPEIEADLDERFKNLPDETKKVVTGLNYRKILYSIAKNYNLNVEQTGTLETVVTNLITGIIYPEEFEDSLKKELKLLPETLDKIIDEINNQIFKKIREKLIKKTEKTTEKSQEDSITEVEAINSTPTTQNTSKSTEIVPEKIELNAPTISYIKTFNTKNTEDEERMPPIHKEGHAILTEKLSGPSKVPMVKTEHTIDNITKVGETKNIPSPTIPTTKVDPYREIPE